MEQYSPKKEGWGASANYVSGCQPEPDQPEYSRITPDESGRESGPTRGTINED
jgi:hypothetical protein